MGSATWPAKVLGGILVLGAVLTGLVASGIGAKKPIRIDGTADLTVAYVVLGAWLLVYLVTAAVVVADAARLTRKGDLDAAQDSSNFVKLIAIPFFVLNFIALTEVVTVVGANDDDRLGLDGFIVAPLLVLLTYLVFLPTSAYGVACLTLMRRGNQIGRTFFGINMALHFLFVVDVLSAIVVVEVARDRLGVLRRPGTSRKLLAGVLIVGSSVATLWLACVAISHFLHVDAYAFVDLIWYLTLASPAVFTLLVLIPVVPLVTFRAAVRLFLADDLAVLRRSALTVKLALIPLFVQNFILCAIIVLGLALLPIAITRGAILLEGPAGLALVGATASTGLVPAVIGTYLMMLPTSIYSVTCLALMMRHRAISPRFCALHVILQFIFVADIISTLIVAHRALQIMAGPVPPGASQPALGSRPAPGVRLRSADQPDL
ncbi:hypothetical protein AB0L70_04385 [Kribbella sp. NPDC051952]|uniref:hypothetical protein n=1 Tax=Kribbella sp. NPDC051952 TaxID=3154851 RepID=UPI003437C4C4